MPLSAGTQLGPYEILSPLGAGGMGEVYRAKDSKLDREVAIKILPEAWAKDPERLARFEREAKVLASLNHPNIAQIYGVESGALVMELVAGGTLTGPLPLETALDYARQIAEALEAAHEKGIVHRDLKPANVLVTPEGVVKVLDFGLAADGTGSASDSTISPTITMRATQAGMIMGTAAYMSPEQASGKPVDKRADIWSFGVVLWEMLTGWRLFDGETISHTLADVLRGPIDFEKLPKETPGRILDLLRRCLDRDVKTRLRDIGEARVVIGKVLADPASRTEVPGRLEARRPWIWMTVSGALALGLIVAGALLYNATRPGPLKPLIRLNAEIAPDTQLDSGSFLALSPDGTRLALTLRGADGKARLYTRLLNQSQVTPLAGTENAYFPFFSPDGEWIGFFADGKLKKISVEGGAAVTLCDVACRPGRKLGRRWQHHRGAGHRRPLAGPFRRRDTRAGDQVELRRIIRQRWPQVLPGSQAILFTASARAGNYDDANIDVISLKTGERKTVAHGGYFPRYLATSTNTGHLIYLHQSTLFAVPFDPGRLAPTGSPRPFWKMSAATDAGGDFAFAADRNFRLPRRRRDDSGVVDLLGG